MSEEAVLESAGLVTENGLLEPLTVVPALFHGLAHIWWGLPKAEASLRSSPVET